MDNQFVWVNFYKEFASKLLAYKNNRGELVEKVKAIYAETGINMPTLEKDNQLVDIDPFTVFGLFNKSSMREANRIKIITAVRKIFDVVTAVPDSFDSIPVLNNQNATFYYFIDSRGDEDIDDLWNLFDSALKYAAIHQLIIEMCFQSTLTLLSIRRVTETVRLLWDFTGFLRIPF